MNGSILTFGDYHGRQDIGSSRIRGEWVMKHWPKELGTCEPFVQSKPYDFVIYQKVYWPKHAKAYKGVKILDMCDADWYDWEHPIIETIQYMDAITTSTEALAVELRKMVAGLFQNGYIKNEIPVVWIDDRVDPEYYSEKKVVQNEKVEWVTWYGYGHNLQAMEPVFPYLKNRGYKVCIVSDRPHAKADKNLPWTKSTVNRDLVENSDIIINPRLEYGKWQYKSDNKTIGAWALGIPVARTVEEFEKLLSKDAREKEVAKRLVDVQNKYHPRQSAIEYVQIILDALKRK